MVSADIRDELDSIVAARDGRARKRGLRKKVKKTYVDYH
jgi:hypothetical protein